jgi:hypothetical protein
MSRFYVHDEQSEIPVAPGGVALPGGSAFMFPGVYIVNGISYDCSRQGLYTWFDPAGSYINRVVLAASPALDVYAVISAISWNHVHGTGTESDFQSMSNAGRFVTWTARCGHIAGMIAWLMEQPPLNVAARVRNATTLGAKNGFDDGHIVVETWHVSEWRMWDVTSGCYYRDSTGKHLSTAEFVAHIANGGPIPEKIRLGHDKKYNHDYATLANGKALDLGKYWEDTMSTPELFEIWCRRIFQSIV